MACPKNPKRTSFFFFNVMGNGPHDYEYRAEHWAREMFEVTATCKLCGSSHNEFGITWDEMLGRGFDPDFLKYIRYKDYSLTEAGWREEVAQRAKSKEDGRAT